MNFKLIQQALVALEMYREYTPEGNGVAEQAIVAYNVARIKRLESLTAKSEVVE